MVNRKKILGLVLAGAIICALAGCSGIEPPMPDELLTHPLGTSPLHLGMAKDEVRDILGEPDSVQHLEESGDLGATGREEWIYRGRVTNLPVSYGYLSKSLYLTFDGENLVSFHEKK
ncbi:MAG: hypothetical protein ABH825_03715 [Candidatus Omnitrophota bacterium]